MRTLTPAIRVVALAVAMLVGGCEAKHHPVDLAIRVSVRPEAKSSVVAVLDRIAAERGWTKTPADGDLRELFKREVIFWSYGRKPKEMLLVITDLKKPQELEVNAFFEPTIPGVVEEVAARFSAEVKSVPGVSSVVEEPRKK